MQACAEYERRCPADLTEHVAPGAPELLEKLAARDDVSCRWSPATSSASPAASSTPPASATSSPPARARFGSDSEDRADLPALARARAGDIAPEQHRRHRRHPPRHRLRPRRRHPLHRHLHRPLPRHRPPRRRRRHRHGPRDPGALQRIPGSWPASRARSDTAAFKNEVPRADGTRLTVFRRRGRPSPCSPSSSGNSRARASRSLDRADRPSAVAVAHARSDQRSHPRRRGDRGQPGRPRLTCIDRSMTGTSSVSSTPCRAPVHSASRAPRRGD